MRIKNSSALLANPGNRPQNPAALLARARIFVLRITVPPNPNIPYARKMELG